MNNEPLKGWRIAITRAKDQAKSLSDQLTDLGATVIKCPMIEIAPPTSWDALDVAISKLDDYDWLVFTSTNAVGFFFKRLTETGNPAILPSHLKICSVGTITASRLSESNIHVDLIPASNNADGLLAALAETLGPEQLSVKRFLFPRARSGRDVLPNGLRQFGATVDVVEAYQTIRPDCDRDQLIRTLKSETDIIVFSSPSIVRNLAELLGDEDFGIALKNVSVACIGPTTRQSAVEKGLSVPIEPQTQTIDDLIESILAFTKSHQKKNR